MVKLSVELRRYRLKRAFAISRGSRSEACVLVVRIEQDGVIGSGECVPYTRYGETVENVTEAILSLQPPFDRRQLQRLLPPGAARNAVDCAFWDLEAKQSGRRVWELAGLELPEPVSTALTLSLDTPESMRARARENADFPILKIKLGGGAADIARIEAVREGSPDARLIVDANEGWSRHEFAELVKTFGELEVEMVEQPFPAGEDDSLADADCPFDVCADESCHGVESFEQLPAGYSMINIKLDKTGGLTEALELRRRARDAGYRVMIGCMIGSSLGTAPALLVAQGADVADLDGPLLLAEDHPIPLHFEKNRIAPSEPGLWG